MKHNDFLATMREMPESEEETPALNDRTALKSKFGLNDQDLENKNEVHDKKAVQYYEHITYKTKISNNKKCLNSS